VNSLGAKLEMKLASDSSIFQYSTHKDHFKNLHNNICKSSSWMFIFPPLLVIRNMLKAIVFFLPLLATTNVAAVCANFKFAIGNVIGEGPIINRWNVYDNNCNIVDGLTTNENPCNVGIFGCSPSPIIFNQYVNTYTGSKLTCASDTASESCSGDPISVCCQ